MFVVLNHLPERFSSELLTPYPIVNILVAGMEDFDASKRTRLFLCLAGQLGGDQHAPHLEHPLRHLPLALAQAANHFRRVVFGFRGDFAANDAQPFEPVIVWNVGFVVAAHPSIPSNPSGVTRPGGA